MNQKPGKPGISAIATPDDVCLAYQLILGRMPDPSGLSYFASLAKSQSLDAHDIAKLLIGSEEFRTKGNGTHEPVEIELDGYSIFVRKSDRDIGSAISRGVSYEPHVTALLRRELHKGNTFLDVGANIGYFTMLGAKLVGAAGRVIAVEPMDKNLQLVYLGIRKNAFEHVRVMPFGASNHSGIVSIVTDPNTSNALVQSAPTSSSPSNFAPVQTLDWLCRDLDALDFVKMDIEGHEVFAWQGAERIFAKYRPRIATEFHPYALKANSGLDYNDYLSMMFKYARSVQVIASPQELITCTEPHQVMEQWEKFDQRYGSNGTSHLDLFLSPRD